MLNVNLLDPGNTSASTRPHPTTLEITETGYVLFPTVAQTPESSDLLVGGKFLQNPQHVKPGPWGNVLSFAHDQEDVGFLYGRQPKNTIENISTSEAP
jgi:hypothetical protein